MHMFAVICGALFMTLLTNEAIAVCCREDVGVIHNCHNITFEKVASAKHQSGGGDLMCDNSICYDGFTKPSSEYCGHGPCNLFGCACIGRCRTNPSGTVMEATKLFNENYYNKKKHIADSQS